MMTVIKMICFYRFISSDHIDEEDGDFKARDDREHRSTAEQEKNRVSWNIDRRCYMDSFANKRYNHFSIFCS